MSATSVVGRNAVRLASVSKAFGNTDAVIDLNLSLEAGSFTALLGPSGCGKSTTLKMIAGLERPDRGDIHIAGESMRNKPPENRPLSLVLQKPLLFPHLTVGQNVAFGLRMRGESRTATRESVSTMLAEVQLSGFEDRNVAQLSGGQEQRVSLARALVLRPDVLLLDEPFSQLDASLRSEMRQLVRELHEKHHVTTLFVTHDQAESVEVADRIVLMLNGRLESSGTPKELFTEPPTLLTARFLGATNEIVGTVTAGTFHTGAADLNVPGLQGEGKSVLVVRPESILESHRTTHRANTRVMVSSLAFAGTHVVIAAGLRDGQQLTIHAPIDTGARPGEEIAVYIPAERCGVFAPEEN